ncbi:tetratricopeptide repeat (TPR)-like superfamily protein isoform X2 [Wolffia australiana]
MFCLSMSICGSSAISRVPADVTCSGFDFSRLRARNFVFSLRSSSGIFLRRSTPVMIKKSSCYCFEGNHVSRTEDNAVWKNSVKFLAVSVIGSLLFLGNFGRRPALSIADTIRGAGAATEEKLSTDGEEDMAERLLDSNPKDLNSLKMVFYEKMKKGKTREAVSYVERLIEAEPEEVEWRLLQALCYELMGRLSKAKQLFRDILEEKPLQLRALHGLALVMHKNREGPAVFEMLRKALELARREQRITEERNIRILIAQMHVVMGDLEGGLGRFQKLAEENPRDFRPYLCQGIIYSLLERSKEAEEQFEIYRSLVPEEFPQRSFLDDVILSAKAEAQGQPQEQAGASK